MESKITKTPEQLKEMAKFRLEKLKKTNPPTWNENDTKKLREFLSIPELESAGLQPLPNSELVGLHLVFKSNSNIDVGDFIKKALATGRGPKNKSRILDKFSFLIIDGLDFSEHSGPSALDSSLTSNTLNQVLHQDNFKDLNLFHPKLKLGQKSRSSPTYIADAKLFLNYIINELNTQTGIDPEAYNLKDSVLEFIKNNKDRIKTDNLTREERRFLRLADYGTLPSDKFINEGNTFRLDWQENRWVIFNDETLVHGRGAGLSKDPDLSEEASLKVISPDLFDHFD